MFFTKYTLFAEKMFLYGKKSFTMKSFFTEKTFFTEKNINEYVKNISHISQKYIFTQKMFVLETKYKSFLIIYSLCKKCFFDHKKYIC